MSSSRAAWPAHLTCSATAASWSSSWNAPLPTSACTTGDARVQAGEGQAGSARRSRDWRYTVAWCWLPRRLQASYCPLSQPCKTTRPPHLLAAAADQHHRPAVGLRVAQPCQAVHHAGAGHSQQHPRGAGQEAGSGGGIARGLLVAAGDEADAAGLDGCRVGQQMWGPVATIKARQGFERARADCTTGAALHCTASTNPLAARACHSPLLLDNSYSSSPDAS